MKTISLFGEVWGVGPATALKLYDKGHRTLEDLKTDPSLTRPQKLGLQYFDDIKTRIPRHEVSSCAFVTVSIVIKELLSYEIATKLSHKDLILQ